MPGPNFHETIMGDRFFGTQLPRLISALERLAAAVEESNTRKTTNLTPIAPKKTRSGATICPNCERFIEQYEKKHGNISIPHCKWCGQAIDWDLEKEAI